MIPADTAANPACPAWMVNANTSIPMLPALATQILETASDPEVSVLRMAQIVAKDQVLAARLLGLANSAYCAPMRPVTTVTEAIVRVGASGVRNLVFTVCFSSRMYDSNIYGEHGRLLIDHAIGTAYLSRLIAERVEVPEDEAFLCGLLHDIGKLVIRKMVHDYRRTSGGAVDEPEVLAAIDDHHCRLGGVALRRWRLPATLDEAVVCHHNIREAIKEPRRAAVTYLANRLSHRYGFGCDPDAYNLLGDPVCREFDIDAAWLESTDAHAPGLYEVAREFFDGSRTVRSPSAFCAGMQRRPGGYA